MFEPVQVDEVRNTRVSAYGVPDQRHLLPTSDTHSCWDALQHKMDFVASGGESGHTVGMSQQLLPTMPTDLANQTQDRTRREACQSPEARELERALFSVVCRSLFTKFLGGWPTKGVSSHNHMSRTPIVSMFVRTHGMIHGLLILCNIRTGKIISGQWPEYSSKLGETHPAMMSHPPCSSKRGFPYYHADVTRNPTRG